MPRLLHFFGPASVLGLLTPLTGYADLGTKLCPPKPCPAPAQKIIVEMSPPQVVFSKAPEKACPEKACPGTCARTMYCFPYTLPPAPAGYAPAPGYAYAPAPVMTPGYAYAPPPPPPAYAPGMPPAGYACPPAGFAPPAPYQGLFAPPAGPAPCGSAGFAPGGPAAGASTAHLQAALAAQRAFEEEELKSRHAALAREVEDVSAKMAARGISPAAAPGR